MFWGREEELTVPPTHYQSRGCSRRNPQSQMGCSYSAPSHSVKGVKTHTLQNPSVVTPQILHYRLHRASSFTRASKYLLHSLSAQFGHWDQARESVVTILSLSPSCRHHPKPTCSLVPSAEGAGEMQGSKTPALVPPPAMEASARALHFS